LKKALEDRIAALNRAASWTDIIADLNALTETEIVQDGNASSFALHRAPPPASPSAPPAWRYRRPCAQPSTIDLPIRPKNVVPRRRAWLQLSFQFNHFTKPTVEDGSESRATGNEARRRRRVGDGRRQRRPASAARDNAGRKSGCAMAMS